MEDMTEELKVHFEKWATEREAELFEVDKFKRIGKEHDYHFQILCFMQTASQKMSIAFTLTDQIDNFPKELEEEFRAIACQYHELQDKVRELKGENKVAKLEVAEQVGLKDVQVIR